MTGQLKGKPLQTQSPLFRFGSVLAGQSSLRPTQGRWRRNVLRTIPPTKADVSASSKLLKTRKRCTAFSLCFDANPFGMNRFGWPRLSRWPRLSKQPHCAIPHRWSFNRYAGLHIRHFRHSFIKSSHAPVQLCNVGYQTQGGLTSLSGGANNVISPLRVPAVMSRLRDAE